MNIRRSTPADLPFLEEMLVEAAHPPWILPRPTLARTLADPIAGRYLLGWGRVGDQAVIAEDRDGNPIGAAWYRTFDADEPGFGFVAADVPEIALAVAAPFRGQRVGTALIAALVEVARAEGERALSLSVSVANPSALRIYQSAGFVPVGGDAESPTMLLDLSRRST